MLVHNYRKEDTEFIHVYEGGNLVKSYAGISDLQVSHMPDTGMMQVIFSQEGTRVTIYSPGFLQEV